MCARREEVAGPKVDDFYIAGLADEDVLYLQISVNDAVSVAVIKGTGDLTTEFSSLFLFEFPMGDDIVKHLTAIHELE